VETVEIVNKIITSVFAVCYFYQFVYIAVSLLKKKRIEDTSRNLGKYAVLICARNEQTVIGDLLDSIANQIYPSDLIVPFVIADNCTDDTAEMARNFGAVVYERFDSENIGKGYALNELLGCIGRDYPDEFDGYFIFDADNVLSPDYISEINSMLVNGSDIVTGYRNSKNYDSNWISAGYALWFLRESRFLNNARYLIGSSCAVSGTGFVFSRRIFDKIKSWEYYLLTEDIEFSVDMITSGERIDYCDTAELYDEQPFDFRQSCRQRLRWSRGYLQVFGRYGKKLLHGITHGSFSCFDMTMTTMPAFLLSSLSIVLSLLIGVFGGATGGSIMTAVRLIVKLAINAYLMLYSVGLLTTVSEWNRIQTDSLRKIFYTFTFPIFMFTYIPISLVSLFYRPEWKPIEHTLSLRKLSDKYRDVGKTALK